MTIGYGPRVITDGLILALDAADINSFDEYENIITNSEFEYLQLSGSTVATANQLFVPYGRNTAVNFNNNGGAGVTYIYRDFNTTLASGTKYVISVFSNSPTLVLGQGGLASGKYTQISSGSITLSNGWYRHWVSYSATVNNPNITPQVVVAQGINVTLSGWQVETGTEITEYYQTGGTAKTRGSTWIDLMGNGNNGTLTNGPTYSSTNGGSIVFDGTNDYVNSTSISSQFTGDITAEAWVYLASYASDWVRIIGTGGNTGNRTFGLWYYGPTGQLLWQRYGAIDPSIFQASPFLSTGTWHHIVATTSGSSHVLYLNASTIGTATASGPWAASNENITIGFAGFHTYHNGRMSNLKLYNRALTAAEVQQNFQALRGRFGI